MTENWYDTIVLTSGPFINMTARQKFWSQVDKAGSDECWLWLSHRSQRTGYGRFMFKDTEFVAHRIAYELANGQIPDELEVRHTCDNRACVNPNHLILGTHQQNIQDMHIRGRAAVGERQPNSKLTDAAVRTIRCLPKNEQNVSQLAERFGVSKSTIRGVLRKRSWKHIISDAGN